METKVLLIMCAVLLFWNLRTLKQLKCALKRNGWQHLRALNNGGVFPHYFSKAHTKKDITLITEE